MIGALTSVLLIWVVTAILVGLAIQRVRSESYNIDGIKMVVTASLGVAFNIAYVCAAPCLCKNVLTLESCGFDKHGETLIIFWKTASVHFRK